MNLDSQPAEQPETATDLTHKPRFSLKASTTGLLVVILIVAVLLRLGSALYQGNTVTDLPGIYDQISYDALARRVVEGHGFSFAEGWWPVTPAGEPTAHWSYLYTLYLAAVYALTGAQPVIARLLQALIAGVIHTWLVWRVGRHVFGQAVGLIAAALSAVYIYFFYYAGGLVTETFYIIGILWTLDAALRLAGTARRGDAEGASPKFKWWPWLELGLAIGLTALVRQVFLLFVPFLYLWLWWQRSGGPPVSTLSARFLRMFRWSVLKGFFGATLIVVLLIVPWTVRNYRAFGTLTPLNTNAGYAFFWGNHPIHGTKFIPLLPIEGPSYVDLIPEELLPLNEAELDRALLREAMGFIADDPVRFILLSTSRTSEYFRFWPTRESSTISNLSRVGSFGILMPFMLYGLVVAIGRIRKPTHEGQRAESMLLYLFIVVYTGIHLLSWTLIRYRLPVDAVLLIFAAFGIKDIALRIKPLLMHASA